MNSAHNFVPEPRFRGRLVALLCVALLAVMALMGYLIWSGYQEAIRTAEITSRNYAAIIEAQLDATLRRADAHLQELVRELPAAALNKQAVPRYARELDAALDLRLLNFPELGGLRVFDADGDMIYTSNSKTTPRTNIVDRRFFRQARDGRTDSTVFSEALTARATGRSTMFVARTLRDDQGAFRGVAIAAVELEYLQKLFQSLNVGPQGVIAIHRSDDFTQVVRWPPLDSEINKPLAPDRPIRHAITIGKKSGTASVVNVDGVARILSFRKLERYPFFVASALGREDVLAGWKARSLAVGLSGLMLLALLARLLYRLWRAESLRAQAVGGLVESEYRRRELVAMVPGAVYEFRIDPAGHRSMPFISEGVVELTGLPPADIMSDVEVAFRQVPAAAMPAMEQSIRDSLENLTPWLHEFPYRTTTGVDKWLRGHAIPQREADGSTRWRGVFVDVTDRKRAEESRARLAAIVEHASDAIIGRALDGTITSWNAAAQRLYGYTAAEAIGRPIGMLRAPGLPLRNLPYNNETLLRGDDLPPIETKRITKAGLIIDVISSISPIKSEAGEVIGAAVIVRDISARKQAEEALRASEERFRILFEQAAVGVAVVESATDRYIRVNQKFADILGYTIAEMLQHTGRTLTHSDDLPANLAYMERLRSGELASFSMEKRYYRKDGVIVWANITVSPMKKADGTFDHHTTVVEDITQRKTTESVLRLLSAGAAHLSGEAFFNEMASQAARFLEVEIGFVGRLLAATPPRIRTLGLSIDGQRIPALEYALAGTPCEAVIGGKSGFFPRDIQQRFPADRVLVELAVAGYAAVPLFNRKGHPIGHIGVMSRAPLRHPEHMEALLRLFAVRVAAEIERQETEAKFQDLFEFSPDAILMVNEAGRIVLANRWAELTFGYSREELLALPVEKLVPEAARRGHAGLRTGFLSKPVPRSMGASHPDLQGQKKDGTTFPADISLHPMHTADGMMVVTTVRDITAQKQAEAARQVLGEQLRQAQKMEAIGTLAGGIAHDFNNILGAIIGNTELARQDVGADHPALESLAEIDKASVRAKDLVQQILAFSRKQPLVQQAITLCPIIAEAVKLMRAALPAGIQLTTDCSADVHSAKVMADATQVQQAIINLCSNAAHALGGMQGRIDVELGQIELEANEARAAGLAPGQYLHVSVRDTGRGMDAATLEHIFDPFFTTKAVGEGTGLGLSVVHGIMQAHGGAVSVDSQPGVGSTFHLYFPVADVTVAHEATEPELPAPATAARRGKTVMYVDDDEALVNMLTRLLERQGYRVSGHTSAKKALDVLRADPHGFDLVVTDYNMPEMSGLDLAREIHAMRADLPVALTSGYITDELRRESADAGVSAVIYKPNTVDELCEAVHRLTSG